MREELRNALYARVSSEQQAGDSTIASQLAALEMRVSEDGLIVLPKHRLADDGYSGATLVRPALERLRDLAASGAVDRRWCTEASADGAVPDPHGSAADETGLASRIMRLSTWTASATSPS